MLISAPAPQDPRNIPGVAGTRPDFIKAVPMMEVWGAFLMRIAAAIREWLENALPN